MKRGRFPAAHVKKASTHKSGYVYVALTDAQGHETKQYIHRLLMLIFHPIENADDFDVNHKDGDKQNNSLTNVEWMTHQQNIIHARETLKAWPDRKDVDLSKKLSDDDVLEIRGLRSEGMFQTEIARRYGISQPIVGYIVRRKAWAYVAQR